MAASLEETLISVGSPSGGGAGLESSQWGENSTNHPLQRQDCGHVPPETAIEGWWLVHHR